MKNNLYLVLAAAVLALACLTLSIDRVRLHQRYNSVGAVIDEKNIALQEKQAKHESEQQKLLQRIYDLEHIFHFVTEQRNPQELTAASLSATADSVRESKLQTAPEKSSILLPEDAATADRLALQVQQPATPANAAKVFKEYLSGKERKGSKLYLDPETGCAYDRDAEILRKICEKLNLQTEITLLWNSSWFNLERRCQAVISQPPPKSTEVEDESENAPALPESHPVTITWNHHEVTGDNIPETEVRQTSEITTIFSFDPFQLSDKPLLMAIHEIPVGGLYAQIFTVERSSGSTAEDWILEYELPTGSSTAEINLQAVPLLSGRSIASATSGNLTAFRIPFVNGKSSVLIVGDRIVIPDRVSAFTGEQKIFPVK